MEKPAAYQSTTDLKFPNVRLHLRDLIAKDNHSPSYAMAQSAVLYGLIPERALKEIAAVKPFDMCLCMASAGEIIAEYMKTLPQKGDFPSFSYDHVLSSLTRAAKSHLKSKTAHNSLSAGMNLPNHDCCRFAPILFDLMLQQLLRYPGLD